MSSGLGAVITYAVLTVLWSTILAIYLRQRRAARGDALISLLLSVLILDAAKTVIESAYFGLVWGANYGLLPEAFKTLSDPLSLTLVKLLNVGVAVVVLVWLARRWVPTELAHNAAQREQEAALRAQLEASLHSTRESEERFRLAADASRDFVWDADLRTGHVYTSPRFPELLGYAAEEWQPTTAQWNRIVHPEDLAGVQAAVLATLKGTVPTYEARYRAVRKDGGVLQLHAKGTTVRDANGRATRFAGFIRDVTQELAAEASRVQSQKLESLGLLAGGIAHDFNNLLTVLSASVSLAERQTGPQLTETLNTASLAVERATALTRQLLAYAGRSKISQVPLDLNQVVAAIGELLTVSISRKVTLSRELAPELPQVLGDDGQLQQVVMNLVTNAAEAIGDREGSVTLRTEVVELTSPPDDVVGPSPLGRVVKLSVSDTGSGMSAETKARIFDPFFSTKGSGRGLGLAALAGILRSHGGAIGLTSTVGVGTTFSVYLPALDGPSKPAAKERAPTPRVPLSARVLLVDDEPLLRRSASRLLGVLGCTVVEAGTGLEAVQKVTAAPTDFDVVLMDLTMPEMDGYEATRRISTIAPTLPVVLSSGYSAADDSGLPEGVRSLSKPYDAKRLEATLREVLRR
jgi:two-component system, cell cycle sensor histidine kinase and response regulator CckA